jgi:hypothetical protein
MLRARAGHAEAQRDDAAGDQRRALTRPGQAAAEPDPALAAKPRAQSDVSRAVPQGRLAAAAVALDSRPPSPALAAGRHARGRIEEGAAEQRIAKAIHSQWRSAEPGRLHSSFRARPYRRNDEAIRPLDPTLGTRLRADLRLPRPRGLQSLAHPRILGGGVLSRSGRGLGGTRGGGSRRGRRRRRAI